jgi:hypothetical protein
MQRKTSKRQKLPMRGTGTEWSVVGEKVLYWDWTEGTALFSHSPEPTGLPRDRALAAQRVDGDDGAFQRQHPRQRRHRGDSFDLASVATCANTMRCSQPQALTMCNAICCWRDRTSGEAPCRLLPQHPYRRAGQATFTSQHDSQMRLPWKAIVSVKGGDNVAMVRDLAHVVDRGKAKIGIFIALAQPTGPMRPEAVKTEYGKFPKVQILTIADLFNGKKPQSRSWIRAASRRQQR